MLYNWFVKNRFMKMTQ